jgi:hypothetical protein
MPGKACGDRACFKRLPQAVRTAYEFVVFEKVRAVAAVASQGNDWRNVTSQSPIVNEFGLQESRTTSQGTAYLIDEEPAELAELRRQHPGWRQLEEDVWRASVPGRFGLFLQGIPIFRFTGGAREHGFLVFQSMSAPNKLRFQVLSAGDEPNRIAGGFTIPAGFRLLAIFHVHPFVNRTAGERGPSDVPGTDPMDDVDTALRYPDAFHYIRSLGPANDPLPGEWYYYGARSGASR